MLFASCTGFPLNLLHLCLLASSRCRWHSEPFASQWVPGTFTSLFYIIMKTVSSKATLVTIINLSVIALLVLFWVAVPSEFCLWPCKDAWGYSFWQDWCSVLQILGGRDPALLWSALVNACVSWLWIVACSVQLSWIIKISFTSQSSV